MSVLIVNVHLDGHSTRVRVDDDTIREVGPELRPTRSDDVLDGDGGWMSPGLHDHHLHLMSLAAAESSIDVGPPNVTDVDALEAAVRSAVRRLDMRGFDNSDGASSWIRGVGYHESVAGELDAQTLDRWSPTTPVRLQHRSGAMWILNSEAMRQIDLTGLPTGRIFRGDDLIRDATPAVPVDLAALGARAARWGVTGFTDADPWRTERQIELLRTSLRQRLHLMGQLELATAGPVKVLLDDDRLPTIDDLAETVRGAHRGGRPVALHCVTRAQLVVALHAVADAGPRHGDRIEHAALVPPELIGELVRLGLGVCTQPNFVAERGDEYLIDLDDEDDVADLYRCRSLLAAGVTVAFGTDAPFGSPNPWAALAAARDRTTRTGRSIGRDERLDSGTALRCFTADARDLSVPRTVSAGQPADLIVLPAPLDDLLDAPHDVETTWTMVGGTVL